VTPDGDNRETAAGPSRGLGVFEKYLTVWVLLCIGAGIVLGMAAPGVATSLDLSLIHISEPTRPY